MSDPERLRERGEGFAATLLRAGCEERPSPERMRRTLMAIGVTTVVGSAAGEAAGGGAGAIVSGIAGSTSAKVGASSITLAIAGKWVLIGGIGGLATVGAATELAGPRAWGPAAITPIVSTSLPASRTSPDFQGSTQAPVRPPVAGDDGAEIAPSPRVAPPSRQRNTGAASASSDTEAGNALRPEPRARSAFAGAPKGAPLTGQAFPVPESAPAVAQGPSTDDDNGVPRAGSSELSLRLNSQVMLIDGAWAAVKRNDPAGTLRALSGYELTFPALDLHPEVLFLRMTAEAAMGQSLGARTEAARIVALYPRSVQAKRARELLARP